MTKLFHHLCTHLIDDEKLSRHIKFIFVTIKIVITYKFFILKKLPSKIFLLNFTSKYNDDESVFIVTKYEQWRQMSCVTNFFQLISNEI